MCVFYVCVAHLRSRSGFIRQLSPFLFFFNSFSLGRKERGTHDDGYPDLVVFGYVKGKKKEMMTGCRVRVEVVHKAYVCPACLYID